MDGADHLFAIILLVSATVGFFRGFVRESIALAAWLVGLWVAWHYAWVVNPWLGGALAEPGVREWTGRAIVLLLVLLLGSLAGSIVSYYVRRAVAVAAVDRLLGVAFGLLRGVVLIGLFVLVGRAVNLDLEPWWDETRSMPAASSVANWLERYAQPAAVELYDKATGEAG
ncbi:MAG TPA: CvpA family protein [Steroidobacteraceae bacterium]|jgi:membrane protein required for colicin V production|nr:CvpA family protein [Steroidobacteraceae bacterium]